jgi:hypothetical protein
LSRETALRWLLVGVLAAFAFCLVRAVDQRLVEFPQSHQMLVEGERVGWTNVPPAMLLEMKQRHTVITTNGVDVANPAVLAKFAKGPRHGHARLSQCACGSDSAAAAAGVDAGLWRKKIATGDPGNCHCADLFSGRRGIFLDRLEAGLADCDGARRFVFIPIEMANEIKNCRTRRHRRPWPRNFRGSFSQLFCRGRHQRGRTLDYWHAAVQTTAKNPLVGTGPGTFQRPYERIKSPDAEMARLAHNDYLEQFSDSGIPGGVFYGAWISSRACDCWKAVWKTGNQIIFAIFIGLLGWFVQGLGEFSLYIPALAWPAFTLLGCSAGADWKSIRQKSGGWLIFL